MAILHTNLINCSHHPPLTAQAYRIYSPANIILICHNYSRVVHSEQSDDSAQVKNEKAVILHNPFRFL